MPDDCQKPTPEATLKSAGNGRRIGSIDALRGMVVFTMIFVNDLAGAPSRIVPDWMRHFHGKSGMTFVDLVFPGFLFVVGMSIPFALGGRLRRGEPAWKVGWHILARTLSLLLIGILMVNETPDSKRIGWSGNLWCILMYLAAIGAFSVVKTEHRGLRWAGVSLKALGWVGLIGLAAVFQGEDGHRIITLSPLTLHASWFGILGLIGWSYLVGALVYWLLRDQQTALLGAFVLLLCLYPADRTGVWGDFWLGRFVGIGDTLGSLPSICVAGILLASILVSPQMAKTGVRVRFCLLFIAGCAAGAWLLGGLYGINKNEETPSWCLWACAITAGLWLLFYFITDERPVGWVSKPLMLAGENVLLAYLISEMLPSLVEWIGLGGWYGGLAEQNLAGAVARSAGCSVVILSLTAGLNRLGFWLRL